MNSLLTYYMFKRSVLFFDEWLFYLFLMYCFTKKLWAPLIIGGIFGICATYTAYRNLEFIEMDFMRDNGRDFNQTMLFPSW